MLPCKSLIPSDWVDHRLPALSIIIRNKGKSREICIHAVKPERKDAKFCNQKAINCYRPTVSSNILVRISKASVIELGRKMIPISCLSLQWTSRKSGCPVPNAIRWGETWNASLVSRTIHYSHFMWLEGLTELTRQLFVGRWLKVDCIFPSLRTEMFLGWRPLTLLRCNVGKWE